LQLEDSGIQAICNGFVRKAKAALYPAFVGIAVFFAYPSIVGYQDVATLLDRPVGQRWLANMVQIPGQTARPETAHLTQGVSLDPVITGSASAVAAVRELPEIMIATQPKQKSQTQRVNRELKGDRVVTATPIRPPEAFTAGSLLERHSVLEPLEAGENLELAFVKRLPLGEAIEIASLFHSPGEDPVIDTDLPVTVASLVRESAGNVLAYGAEEHPAIRSPFAAVLNSDEPITMIPKLGKGDHHWAAQPLPLSAFGEREQNCLTAGIYFEARGEPVRGQAAVAQVILNRVKNPAFPNSICGVVYQNKKWRNRCQFSFACDRIKDRVNDPKRWELARYVARETTEGRIWLTQVGSSTHYHAIYVRPKWASRMTKVGRIGLHVFYRTLGGGWS
jgi:spore germination cell wall hydrolase CwlJ-like protein